MRRFPSGDRRILFVVWQDDDIVRSVRRYLGMMLGDSGQEEWKLRVERREVKDEQRPVGVVLSGPIQTKRARSSLVQGGVEEVMPLTISLYPPLAGGSVDEIRSGRLNASKLKSLLNDLLVIGLTLTTTEDGRVRNWAGPWVLPLWDYTDVPVTGTEKEGPEDPHAVLWIEENSLAVQALQDPEDAKRWSVIANFRVTLERPGRIAPEAEVMDVERVVGVEKPII